MVIADDEDKLYELLTTGIPRFQELGDVYVSDALKRLVSGCCQALLFRKLAVQIEGSVFGQGKGFFPQLRIGQIQIFFDLQQCV